MSSIKLKKPHGSHMPGAVISVPYGVGLELIRDGIGIYPAQETTPVVTEAPVSAPPPPMPAAVVEAAPKPAAPPPAKTTEKPKGGHSAKP